MQAIAEPTKTVKTNPHRKLKAKLREPGLLIGRHPTKDEYLASYGQTFALLAAPPGSGKGVGIIIPNLLTYPDSVIVNDPKLENWTKTAGFRQAAGHECYRFSPHLLETHRYNPFDYVRRDELYRLGDIKKLSASWFVPDNPKNAGFYRQAGGIFNALLLYMLETPSIPCNPAQLYRLQAKGTQLGEWVRETIDMRNESGHPLSDETQREMGRIVTLSQSESGFPIVTGILDEKMSAFSEYTVAYATSASDFDFRDVRKKRMSIFFSIPSAPSEMKKFAFLMNSFFSHVIESNAYELPEEGPVDENGELELKYQVLLVMDELAVMGVIEALKIAPALMRQYNIRFLLICQNKEQLRSDDLYGHEGANAIIKALHIEIVYAPADEKDAREYSERLGTTTYIDENDSKSFGKSSSRSRNKSKHARALMLPQEIKDMPYENQLIFIQPTKNNPSVQIYARKIMWYEDELLASRANMPLPTVPEATIEDVQKILSGSDNSIRKVRLRPEYESAFDKATSNNPPLN